LKEKEREILENAFIGQHMEQGFFTVSNFVDTRDWCNMGIRSKAIEFLREYRSDFKLATKEDFAAGQQA